MPARTFFALSLLALTAGPATAQQLAGIIVRGETRVPIGGVVLLAESPVGDTVLARTITGARGQFALAVRAGEIRLRALRIGHRPAVLGTFDLMPGEIERVSLLLPENPLTLQAVTLRASARCDVVGKAGEAVATLFEEARKALVATQLMPVDDRWTALVALSNRMTDIGGRALGEPRFSLISGSSVRPFQAVPLEEIERRGYVVEQDGNTHFRAPDASVLLSDSFAAEHCLQLVDGLGERAGWIGIGFKPVRLLRPRVGVAGTLWLERASYELKLLEFEYVGLAQAFSSAGLGGVIEFTRLPSGLWFEDRFELRMPRVETSYPGRGRLPIVSVSAIERTGGEVLSMRTGDSVAFAGDTALERRLLAAVGASGGSIAGITFGAIRGQLTDSLRTRVPTLVAGDTVVLPELGLRAVTDFAGAFDFKGVPAGRYRLMYRAGWFDSVGVSPLEHTLEVRAGEIVEAALATPALATYQQLQCGSTLDSADAILHGEVTDGEGAPLAGAVVIARWRIWTLDQDQGVQRLVERADTTQASGTYILCGVPKDAPYHITAYPRAGDERGAGYGITPMQDINRRDFTLGDPAARVRVRGTVFGPDGKPIRGATVISLSDEDAGGVSRADGSFEVAIRGRWSQQVRVRALGFEPAVVDVNPRAANVELPVIVLTPVAQGLDTMRVTAQRDPLDWRAEFERRRLTGLGRFVTEEQLRQLPRVTPNAFAQLVPRVRVSRDLIWLLRGTEPCAPRWYIDGYDNGTEGANGRGWAQMILNTARSIEVYSAATAPPKFNDFDGCGVIIVWTR